MKPFRSPKSFRPSPLLQVPSPSPATGWCAVLSMAAICLAPMAVPAQTTNTWIRAETSGGDWNVLAHWSEGVVPDADTVVQFNMTESGSLSRVTTIAFDSSVPGSDAGVRNVGSINLLEPDTWGRIIRGTDGSASGAGTLVLHGSSVDLLGEPVNLLVANYTSNQLLSFRTGLSGGGQTRVGLASTGVVYAAPGSTVEFGAVTEDVGGSHGIIKRGGGLMSFITSGGYAAENTYSGGFTLEEGTVQWATSGSAEANPFGTGTLTLRGGTLRSSTSTGRTLYVPVALDGNVEFGVTSGSQTGFITVSSESGTLSTALVSDSILTNHNQVSWNQGIHGTANLTKAGEGLFHITEVSESTFAGTLTVEEGVLRLSGLLENSPVVVKDGARLEGYGAANAGLTAESGASLRPGLDNERGALTVGFLNLAGGSNLEFTFDSNALDGYDSITASGAVSLNGANFSIDLAFEPDLGDVFILIDNQGGLAIDGLLSYAGNPLLQGDQFNVTSGEFSQLFSIDYDYSSGGHANSLAVVAVPEPAVWGILAGLAVLGLALRRRLKGTPGVPIQG